VCASQELHQCFKRQCARKGTSHLPRHVGASRLVTIEYNSKSSPANLVAKQRKRRKRGQGQLELILVGLQSFTFNSLFFINFSSIFDQFLINFHFKFRFFSKTIILFLAVTITVTSSI